ncbi:hypothetical protein [Chitinophaga sp.]|uniref:hypothetical protein n=1 Tax=Chitinophaga sp. TaxID=1869181 RepID=UPI0031D6636A
MHYPTIKTYTTGICRLLFAAVILALPASAQQPAKTGQLNITDIRLDYPSPNIPYYHFKAVLQLPHPSIIEVEAAIDGKPLRATDLRKTDGLETPARPPIASRSPSGYSMAQDGSVYEQPQVIGWARWEPGKTYTVRLTVRLKKTAHASKDDVILSAVKTLRAPAGPAVFSTKWKNYKAVVVSETAGISRTNEPVKALLAFYPDEQHGLVKEVRVVAIDPETHAATEVSSQVFDVQQHLQEDDRAPDKNGKPTRAVPLWLPTVTAQVAFSATVPARQSRVYLIYYNNADAPAPRYGSDLQTTGKMPGLQVRNNTFSLTLHPKSGHLDEVKLNSLPQAPLFHHLETNGAIHWNPDVYIPPRPWTHTSDWSPPAHMHSVTGPVITQSEIWGPMPQVPEVDASVRYEFFPGVPYFIASTSMRINETVNCLALRNAEMVFKRELITHAAWYDVIRDTVITCDVQHMPDLTDLRMEADVPWIAFYNETTGIGFAGIQLEYANAGLESGPRLLNPFFYITAGPWIYWARGLSHTYLSSNMQQVVPAMKGSMFSEKWAYLVYRTNEGSTPYAPVQAWQKRLQHPLRLQLVEEVDQRVSRTLEEVYMNNGKSGWEGRQNKKMHEAAKDSTHTIDTAPSEFFD